ncbi:hypothetical protein BJ138DRAFT_198027 [Hygrophoropsis aurantiaca]|uniref:Uncharacterized protein n=1 Tax=Hygrophoropsis aurantiaca TaxID=72124 RepID=A0ACB8A847_9AGAM|nr:hypothetical protein BJ138DRAFT_198027 [Hygrophoropsis aurantiaca]
MATTAGAELDELKAAIIQICQLPAYHADKEEFLDQVRIMKRLLNSFEAQSSHTVGVPASVVSMVASARNVLGWSLDAVDDLGAINEFFALLPTNSEKRAAIIAKYESKAKSTGKGGGKRMEKGLNSQEASKGKAARQKQFPGTEMKTGRRGLSGPNDSSKGQDKSNTSTPCTSPIKHIRISASPVPSTSSSEPSGVSKIALPADDKPWKAPVFKDVLPGSLQHFCCASCHDRAPTSHFVCYAQASDSSESIYDPCNPNSFRKCYKCVNDRAICSFIHPNSVDFYPNQTPEVAAKLYLASKAVYDSKEHSKSKVKPVTGVQVSATANMSRVPKRARTDNIPTNGNSNAQITPSSTLQSPLCSIDEVRFAMRVVHEAMENLENAVEVLVANEDTFKNSSLEEYEFRQQKKVKYMAR